MGKRIFSALFILILTMAFTACGAKPQDQTTGDTAHEGSTPASSVSQAETAYGIQDVEFFRDNMKISGELLLPDTENTRKYLLNTALQRSSSILSAAAEASRAMVRPRRCPF